MEAFTSLDAIGIPVDIPNCDTDQIIPARFLRYTPDEPGYARFLCHDLRFDEDGGEKPAFIYNQAPFSDGQIIVADINWGCGSSRENAVYALVANNIRCVIAPSFGDIHRNNCMKQGVLPVLLPVEVCDAMRQRLHDEPGTKIQVDLEAQSVVGPAGDIHAFDIGAFDKYRLLNGLDEIGVTLEYQENIEAYEATHFAEYSWMSR